MQTSGRVESLNATQEQKPVASDVENTWNHTETFEKETFAGGFVDTATKKSLNIYGAFSLTAPAEVGPL